MTKEVMQQALEALEKTQVEGYNLPGTAIREAITAIREALAQPEQEVSCRFCYDKGGCWAWQCYHCGEIDDVQQPTPPAAQPEQEPVAWMVKLGEVTCFQHHADGKHASVPLYTTPPLRERKPLTQRQVVEGFCKTPHQVQSVAVFDAGVRFAEAAHNIGGAKP